MICTVELLGLQLNHAIVCMIVVVYSSISAITCGVSWPDNYLSALEKSHAALYGDWQSDSVVSNWFVCAAVLPSRPAYKLLCRSLCSAPETTALHCTPAQLRTVHISCCFQLAVKSLASLMRWLQLRFEFYLTPIRLQFDRAATIRRRYELRPLAYLYVGCCTAAK